MAGLSGDWQAHAIDTAKAVSAMKPEFIAFLTLRVYSALPCTIGSRRASFR